MQERSLVSLAFGWCSGPRHVADGHGAARDADRLVVLVRYADLPDLARAPDVGRDANGREGPAPLGPDVARVDLGPEGGLARRAVEVAADARHALCQHHAHPAVEVSE